MKGKRFLDTKVAPDYMQAVYGVPSTYNSDTSKESSGEAQQQQNQSGSLLSALGNFGLMQPSQEAQDQSRSGGGGTVASSSGAGDTDSSSGSPSVMPLTTRQKLLFVQDPLLLLVAFSCKIENRNGTKSFSGRLPIIAFPDSLFIFMYFAVIAFRLFLVAPLLYVGEFCSPFACDIRGLWRFCSFTCRFHVHHHQMRKLIH